MNQESIINQKEYLKRYLSGKNKKKRKKKDKVTVGRLNVIDDDVDVFTQELHDDNLESEDAPQIVAVFDERPPSMQVDEKTKAKLWKPIGEIITIKEENDSDEEIDNKTGLQFEIETNRGNSDDNSPPRRRNDDNSPPRRRREPSSPPRRRTDDNSPPRRKNEDSSPRRRKNDDYSPPRKRNYDNSPPRRRNNVDKSPPRRKNVDSKQRSYNSPPRRNNNEKRSKNSPSRSPAHKKKRSKSPVFRNKSPPIQTNAPPKRKSRFSSPVPETSTNHLQDASPPRKRQLRTEKTLDGKKAGLQNANDLAAETRIIKDKENEMFAKMSADVSGKGATTVVRNRKPAEDPVEVAKRLQREKEMKEKYDKWGKGLKQVGDQKERMEEELYEMSKPLARYADDEDLERHLKAQEREGDPMLAYIRKKKRKDQVDAGVKVKPQYEGEFLPNRFAIRPGCRWDGVDRSNGYEKKWFDVQNAKMAQQDETYKWSTEDM